ncbi:MAG: DUF2868 domain-containing protein, partial [Pirellulales bacterium]
MLFAAEKYYMRREYAKQFYKEGVSWTLGDVIDYEQAVSEALDSSSDEDSLRLTGESLSRKFSTPDLRSIDRRKLFLCWLGEEREQGKNLYGRRFDDVLNFVHWLLFFSGIVVGVMAVGSFLVYRDNVPINVSLFWFVFVLVPWIFTFCFLLMSWVPVGERTYVLHPVGLLSSGVVKGISKIVPKMTDVNQRWSDFVHVVHEQSSRLGLLSKQVIFGLSQLFALGFGLGALVVVGVKGLFLDLQLAWQTSWLTVEQMYSGVSFLSAPWAWFLPDWVPTLEELQTSQFSPAGELELVPESTHSLWYFVIGCLVFYSCLCRTLTFTAACLMKTHTLSTLSFDRQKDNSLIRRLVGPLFSTEMPSASGELERVVHPATVAIQERATWLLLMANGLEPEEDQVKDDIEKEVQGSILHCLKVELDFKNGNKHVIEKLRLS